jgi:FAD/FMN-containing dehydrogenase
MTTTVTPGTSIDRSPIDPAGRMLLAERLRAAVRGEVEFGSAFRAVYATDSSNYRQVPLGVVFPRDAADVSAAVAVCAEAGAPVLGRGAGTGLAGQTVNVGVVLDFSRHMNAILSIDPDRGIARVQPGVVLDDLRAACEPFGLTFGPDPATHAWCTLGGMIGNNSCGTHALYAGKTVDNVHRLRIVTAAGEDLWVGSYDDADYAAAVARGGTLARLLGGLRGDRPALCGRGHGCLPRHPSAGLRLQPRPGAPRPAATPGPAARRFGVDPGADRRGRVEPVHLAAAPAPGGAGLSGHLRRRRRGARPGRLRAARTGGDGRHPGVPVGGDRIEPRRDRPAAPGGRLAAGRDRR